MRRIAFISTMCGYHPSVPRWAGCEELWGQAALRMQSAGTQVGVNIFAWPEQVPQIEELRASGCLVQERKTIRGLARLSQRFAAQLPTRWLRAFRPGLTVITQHQFHSETEWAERCRELGLRYVLAIHGVNEKFEPSPAYAELLRANYLGAERCYFVSERNRRAVERCLGTALKHVRLVQNPFKVPYHDPPAYPGEPLSLACVARLSPEKGHDLLLEVLSLEKWRQRPFEIHCYGSGEQATALAAGIRARGLSALLLHDFVLDVRSIWARHHGLVLPSYSEGLPIVVVEAMLSDRLCVVTDVGGCAELVVEGETGFIATEPTTAALDAAIERAWERRAEWPEIGRAGGARVRSLIPPDPVGDFVQELSALLDEEGASAAA